MITRPMYEGSYEPTRFWGRPGAAVDTRLMPVYSVQRWAALPFSLGTPKIACDPSDPSTWQRPYVFTS